MASTETRADHGWARLLRTYLVVDPTATADGQPADRLILPDALEVTIYLLDWRYTYDADNTGTFLLSADELSVQAHHARTLSLRASWDEIEGIGLVFRQPPALGQEEAQAAASSATQP